MPGLLLGMRRALLSGRPGLTYLLRDLFTAAAAAPLASPRTCEPGPGTLTLVQNDGQFSISSNKLNFPTQATPAWGDQGLYEAGGRSRVTGRALFGKLTPNTVGKDCMLVWATAATLNYGAFANTGVGFYFEGGGQKLTAVQSGAASGEQGTWTAGTEYEGAIVLRAAGAFLLIRGGAYSAWTLWQVLSGNTTATLYPAFSNYSQDGTLDDFRITDLTGSWASDYGIATQRVSGSVSAGQTFTHEANCLIEWTQDTLPAAGASRILFRRQDSNNYWLAAINASGDLYLFEVVAGVVTQRALASGVVSAGHRIVVVADGSVIRGYSNNTLRWTYSSATNFQSATSGKRNDATDGGLGGTTEDGTVSNLVAWPRDVSSLVPAGV